MVDVGWREKKGGEKNQSSGIHGRAGKEALCNFKLWSRILPGLQLAPNCGGPPSPDSTMPRQK